MNANNETSTDDREIITTRVFDVPRDLVPIIADEINNLPKIGLVPPAN